MEQHLCLLGNPVGYKFLFLLLYNIFITKIALGVSTERTKLIMLGVARIHKTKLLATLSGLKLDAEITGLHSSVTCRNKSRPVSLECSITGQVGRTTIKLLEGVAPNQLQ